MFTIINLTSFCIQAQKTSSADFATYDPVEEQLNSNLTKAPTIIITFWSPKIYVSVPNPLAIKSLRTYPNAQVQVPTDERRGLSSAMQ